MHEYVCLFLLSHPVSPFVCSFQEPQDEEDDDEDEEEEKPPNPPMMVPMADMLNHVSNHNANLEFTQVRRHICCGSFAPLKIIYCR